MTTDTTMTDVDTPKNCPWCGSSARVYQPIEGFDYWTTECTGDIDEESGCFAESPYIAGYDTKEKAVKAWNTRPAESALSSRCDELERLAGVVVEKCSAMVELSKELDGDARDNCQEQETVAALDFATHEAEQSIAALTAYQRKG